MSGRVDRRERLATGRERLQAGLAPRRVGDERPLLAVDVDGVLLPYPERYAVDDELGLYARPLRDGWQEARLGSRLHGMDVVYNPSHGPRLIDIAEATNAELVWCTFWEGRAAEEIAPLVGLPEMDYVPLYRERWGGRGSGRWSIGNVKAAALAIYAGERPFVWLDDEPDAAEALADWPVPHRVVRVADDRLGVTDANFAEARAWLSALAEGEVA